MHAAYFTAFVALTAATTVALAQADDTSIQARLVNGVVRILSAEEADMGPAADSGLFSMTGALISADGHVVSDGAIANRSPSIVAILADGRRYVATLVGHDSFSNLALYKLAGLDHQLSAPAIADDVRDGDSVYALLATREGMRQPFKARVRDARRLLPSGQFPIGPYIEIEDDIPEIPVRGPVFDEQGRIVGLVTLQTSPERKTHVALAIPMVDVKRIADELRASGRVRRSRIGVGAGHVPKDVWLARGLSGPTGAYIGDVSKNSPAERAGLKVGDIIVKLDSTVIESRDDYFVAMARIKAGTRIQLEVLGAAGKRRVSLTTGEVISGPPVGQPWVNDRKNLPPD